MAFTIYRNGHPVNIDDPAQRSTYAPNSVPACCVRCGVSRLADGIRWVRVGREWVCEACEKERERGEMTNPYDMIERLVAMQTVPMTPAEYRASQETIKDAVKAIGELIDRVDRLRAANAELVTACGALLKTFWYDNDADVLEQGEIVARVEQAIAKGEADNG